MSDLKILDRTEAEARKEIAAARLDRLLFTINWHRGLLKGMSDANAGFIQIAGGACVAMEEIIRDFDSYERAKK